MDRKQELQHLGLADRHIAAGEDRIARLEILIDDLDARQCDTSEARRLLAGVRGTLREWVHHRDLIVQRLAQPD